MKSAHVEAWLSRKLGPCNLGIDSVLADDYLITFSTDSGKRVLNHMLESVYCDVYEGNDPTLTIAHNARRSVVHTILECMDMAAHPEHYAPLTVETSDEIAADKE